MLTVSILFFYRTVDTPKRYIALLQVTNILEGTRRSNQDRTLQIQKLGAPVSHIQLFEVQCLPMCLPLHVPRYLTDRSECLTVLCSTDRLYKTALYYVDCVEVFLAPAVWYTCATVLLCLRRRRRPSLYLLFSHFSRFIELDCVLMPRPRPVSTQSSCSSVCGNFLRTIYPH